VGITEVTDAISIIVSEETGIISLSTQGKLTRYLSVLELRGMLILLLTKEKRGGKVKVVLEKNYHILHISFTCFWFLVICNNW